MHVLSLHKLPVFSQIIHGIEHHKLATILGVIAVLCLVYVLNIPVVHQRFIQHSSADSTSSVGIVQPLTLVDDPQYAHEYDIRAQYINEHLEGLKNDTRADRVYLVTYNDGPSQFGYTIHLSHTFEISQEGLNVPISTYQDLSRQRWLYLKRYEYTYGGLAPDILLQGYGIELYDANRTPIGYIGIEYIDAKPFPQGNEIKRLRQTAAAIKTGLLRPLEHLKGREAK